MDPDRDLDWAGMYNVRDLGGLPTRTGGSTRWGALVRSEGLDRLAPEGWSALHRHGVRTCVDLRSGFEIRDASYRPAASDVEVVWAPLEEGLLEDPQFRDWAETGALSCALYYAAFLERWPARVGAVARAIAAAGPGGVLYHCQRGRDRTGLVTLLLLMMADVPSELIVADHLATDERLVSHGLGLGHVGLNGETDLYAARGTTQQATVGHLVDTLDIEDYLLGAGVPGDELRILRDRLVTRG
ncbi:tyrosine-protein phosphatase [Iamia sp.]|uniref:tyrosine-protein phosphatase n=1 Tax=Iamia sp. TaxID=2722710 RepID=UPI002D00EC96|nr:tyrosine-protein phosphatase [Iamia sp.]HXH56321.1 tyrosine-protein phosphatase [Iamia sp.]